MHGTVAAMSEYSSGCIQRREARNTEELERVESIVVVKFVKNAS